MPYTVISPSGRCRTFESRTCQALDLDIPLGGSEASSSQTQVPPDLPPGPRAHHTCQLSRDSGRGARSGCGRHIKVPNLSWTWAAAPWAHQGMGQKVQDPRTRERERGAGDVEALPKGHSLGEFSTRRNTPTPTQRSSGRLGKGSWEFPLWLNGLRT